MLRLSELFLVLSFLLMVVPNLVLAGGLRCESIIASLADDQPGAELVRHFEVLNEKLDSYQAELSSLYSFHGRDIGMGEFPDRLATELVDHITVVAQLKEQLEAEQMLWQVEGKYSHENIEILESYMEDVVGWIRGPYQTYVNQREILKRQERERANQVAKKDGADEATIKSAEWEAVLANRGLIKADYVYWVRLNLPTDPRVSTHAYNKSGFMKVAFDRKLVGDLFDSSRTQEFAAYQLELEKSLHILDKGYHPTNSDSSGVVQLHKNSGTSGPDLYEVRIVGGSFGRFRFFGFRHEDVLHIVHWSVSSNHNSRQYQQQLKDRLTAQYDRFIRSERSRLAQETLKKNRRR